MKEISENDLKNVLVGLFCIFILIIVAIIVLTAPPSPQSIRKCAISETWWADGSGPIGSDYDTGTSNIEEAQKIAGDDRLVRKEICYYE